MNIGYRSVWLTLDKSYHSLHLRLHPPPPIQTPLYLVYCVHIQASPSHKHPPTISPPSFTAAAPVVAPCTILTSHTFTFLSVPPDASTNERAVFIPINTEGFSAWGTGRDGQNRGRDRLGERGIRLRGREERRCAKVENTNCSITRTRGNEVGLMGVKKCLIDTGLVSVESREGMRAFRRPL